MIDNNEYMLLDSKLGEVLDCGVMGLTESGYSNYSIQICHIDKLWREGYYGKNVKIGVVDTGIDYNHTAFRNGQIICGKNFSDNRKPETDFMDDLYHGTCVSGLIGGQYQNRVAYGIAPLCQLIIAKSMNSAGNGSLTSIANGIRYCVDNGAHIINLSVGSTYTSSELEDAVKYAISKNVAIVASAGNDNKEEIDKNGYVNEFRYPGAFNESVCVGAINKDYKACGFSNSNDYIDVVAPGEDLICPYPTLNSGLNNRYCITSGTSFSAPIVSGVLALLREKFINERGGRCPAESELFGQLTMYLRYIQGINNTLQGYGYPDLSINRQKRFK